jgi:hypothetical protein
MTSISSTSAIAQSARKFGGEEFTNNHQLVLEALFGFSYENASSTDSTELNPLDADASEPTTSRFNISVTLGNKVHVGFLRIKNNQLSICNPNGEANYFFNSYATLRKCLETACTLLVQGIPESAASSPPVAQAPSSAESVFALEFTGSEDYNEVSDILNKAPVEFLALAAGVQTKMQVILQTRANYLDSIVSAKQTMIQNIQQQMKDLENNITQLTNEQQPFIAEIEKVRSRIELINPRSLPPTCLVPTTTD